MSDLSKEWPEAKPPKREPGPVCNFRRGYDVNKAGSHESSDQYAAFQKYLLLQGKRSLVELETMTGYAVATLSRWMNLYCWEYRAAEYDKKQMAIVWKEAEKFQRNSHKEAIVEFRQSSERQAKMMARVSEDLLRVLGKRIQKAEEEGEEVPMPLVSGLLRAAASISEQSRQSWANALGINEMLEMVESEMERVSVEEVVETDAYDIPIDD